MGKAGQRQLAQHAQQGVPAHHQIPLVAQTHTGLAPQGNAEGDEALGEPQRAPCPGGSDGGQPFGEDAAATVAITAKPLADAQLEMHAIRRPGQIREGACVVTMDATRWCGAERTGHAGLP